MPSTEDSYRRIKACSFEIRKKAVRVLKSPAAARERENKHPVQSFLGNLNLILTWSSRTGVGSNRGRRKEEFVLLWSTNLIS